MAPSSIVATQAVRAFRELSRADVPFAGGKGANLGELAAAGLPVPDGFVVGAPAYAAFVEETGLRERIAARLDGLDVDDTDALGAACTEVRAEIEATPLPDDLSTTIAGAYAALADGEPAVAVRSSATAEDTASASFAGMNETFLNMRGADTVVDAVRRCWASLFGARTVFYRAKRGLGQADMDIAVVVQRQIASTRAGVMFTIDPATGRDDRLVIEGSVGLGEAVVSGQVSPDRWVVAKRTLHVLAHETRHKELVIEEAPDGHGTVTRPATEAEADAPVLTGEEVTQLAELGRRIEEHYGSPQDTEWAFDSEGRAFILQSRPVTSAGGSSGEAGEELLRGLGAAPGSASGRVRMIASLDDAGHAPASTVSALDKAQPWYQARRKADHQRPPAGRTAPRQSRSQRNHATSSGCLNVASACEAVQTLVATMKWVACAARTRVAQNRREGRIFVEGGALTASLTSRPTLTRH